MAQTPDDRDARLLNRIQEQIPLTERPFAAIASEIGTTEQDVLDRLRRLKSPPRPVIRQISAIFDSRVLGYQSCLVAAKVPEADIDASAKIISEHPGVSHNYRRNHDYNLWFTLAVPPDSRLGLQRTADLLRQRSGALATRLMPSIKLYKIGVKFDLSGEGDPMARGDAKAATVDAAPFTATDADKRVIRVLQQDLPIAPRPFDAWADEAQCSVPQLLAAGQRYIDLKCMRRFSAVLRHREAGFSANAMGVWIVPDAQHDTFGRTAATFAAVSHCYLRPTYPDWPYSIFTMVHAPSREKCEEVLAAIANATGVAEFRSLYSSHEYKKTRVRYFTGDIEAWEATTAQG